MMMGGNAQPTGKPIHRTRPAFNSDPVSKALR